MKRIAWITTALMGTVGCAPEGLIDGGVWTPETAWRLEVLWAAGGAEAEGDEAFGDVRGLAVDGAGRAWVLDYQAQHLVVLDPRGTVVRTVGRRGGGPGEFEGIYGVAVTADQHVWVPDHRNARYTVFDTAGAVIATHRRLATCRGYVWPAGATADGAIRDILCGRVDGDRLQRYLTRFVPEDGTYVDTVVIPPPVDDPPFYHFRFANAETQMAVPFTPEQRFGMASDGSVWSGWSGDYDLVRLGPGGDTLGRVRRTAERVPVDRAERRARVEEILTAAQGQEVDQGLIPDVHPWFERLLPDPDGHLWVMRRSVTARWAFDVFDPAGRYLGSLDVPDDLTLDPYLPIVIRSNHLWAVTRDSLDAPTVTHVRIVGRN